MGWAALRVFLDKTLLCKVAKPPQATQAKSEDLHGPCKASPPNQPHPGMPHPLTRRQRQIILHSQLPASMLAVDWVATECI